MLDTEIATLKVPPHSLEAEQAVLGALLFDNDALDRIADIIAPLDFYEPRHRLILEAIMALCRQYRPADAVTVAEWLAEQKKLEEVGGLAYLGNLVQQTPSTANVRQWAEIVHEHALLRRLAEAGQRITEQALNPHGKEVSLILDEAEARILDVAQQALRQKEGFIPIASILNAVVENLESLQSRPYAGHVSGIPSGFVDLDHMTTGFHPGDLVIIAGRPSMGKTAFALNIAEYVAVQVGLPVAIFSLEMSAPQLASRLLASSARVSQQDLRTGQLSENNWQKLTRSLGILNESPIFIDESGTLSVLEARGRARRLWRQQGSLGLIVVDYLQLMTSARPTDNRVNEISTISRSLKALAKELNVPVLALSQLNRGLEARTNKRPVMADLRESGAIEQDADLILFIYRDEVYYPETADKGMAEIIIGKQRNGPIGTVKLTFLGEYTRFENYAAV